VFFSTGASLIFDTKIKTKVAIPGSNPSQIRRVAAPGDSVQLPGQTAEKALFPPRRLCPAGYNEGKQENLPNLRHGVAFPFYLFWGFLILFIAPPNPFGEVTVE